MNKENNLQIAAINYIRLQYPDILAAHIPNGGKRTAKDGALFKRMGVVAGMPDIMIFDPSHPYSGLAIELKTTDGYVTKIQREIHETLRLKNWAVFVCRSIDEIIAAIDGYFLTLERRRLWANFGKQYRENTDNFIH